MRGMTHHDLLDVAEAYLLEPLVGHPDEFKKFREEVLYAPMEGSKKAKQRAQAAALAAMGLDIATVQAGQGMGRAVKARVPKKKEGTDADTTVR